MKKGDKEREIEKLKKRIEELEKDLDKEKSSEKPVSKNENKRYIRVLIILVIILLVVDLISVVAYYKPDFSSIFKSGNGNNDSNGNSVNGKCSDGTKNGACSNNKPYLCYNGELVLNAAVCGCPSGYVVDFRSCKKV